MNRRALPFCWLLVLAVAVTCEAQAQQVRVSRSRVTGLATFVTAADGGAIPVTPAPGRAQAEPADFLRQYAAEFGIRDVDQELVLDKTTVDQLGFTHTTFTQVFRGVKVFAGVLKVHQRPDGGIVAANGDFFPVPDKLATTPSIAQAEAEALALTTISTPRAAIEQIGLVVVDPGWYGDPPRGAKLAYYIVVADLPQAIREAFFVDAHTGKLLDRWSLIHTERDRAVYDGQNTDNLPGFLVRTEGDPPAPPLCGGAPTPAGFPDCQGGEGDCCEAHGGTGCDDPDCCEVVCSNDDFCCNVEWDEVCAAAAAFFCPQCQLSSCGPGEGDCCEAHATPGCENPECCQALCGTYSELAYCCQDEWDDFCAWVASLLCSECIPTACCLADTCSMQTMDDCTASGGQFEAGSDCNTRAEINAAYDYAGDTYDYYSRAFGRDSLDGAGLTMVATVNSTGFGCPNAFWSGSQIIFCRGLVLDDVVGHELTHGLTQYTANLIYQNQPGQLNESFSDVFGELVDLFNGDVGFVGPPSGPAWPDHETGSGTDEPNTLRSTCSAAFDYPDGVRWLIGEEAGVFGGPIRDMWDPTCHGDPDYANSDLQTCPDFDSGGVHSGSGIPNHAFAILTDGKSFNGYDVTGIGPIKAGAVWYRALSEYLFLASDFEDAFYALNQAALDLVGTTPNDPRTGLPSDSEFTANDAAQVNLALMAVEMNTPGSCGEWPAVLSSVAPEQCNPRTVIFSDSMESGINGWTVSNSGPPTLYDWVQAGDLPYGRTGTAWFCVDPNIGDCGDNDESGSHSLISPGIVLPASVAFPALEFTHFMASEAEWDGGNISIRVNSGGWVLIDGDEIVYNPYNSSILPTSAGNTNPLAGQEGWTGLGGRWGTSLVDLRGYVDGGETIAIRFDFGKDGCGGVVGWYVDDFVVYNCTSGDCNANSIPDDLDIANCPIGDLSCGDVNANGVPDGCDDCTTNANCNDGQFCNGTETCVNGSCVAGTAQCVGLVCNETVDACFQCDDDADCADNLFCNGAEKCSNGTCAPGTNPCPDQICDETTDACLECDDNATCDDGAYCNGPEACENGFCVPGFAPCEGQACDEDADDCYQPQCDTNVDCSDDDICTTDACVNQLCMNTPIPGCADDDDDGIRDDADDCPDTAGGAAVNAHGCSCDQLDDDGDGVDDCTDECRKTPAGEAADEAGCSCSQRDSDADGVNDCDDQFPDSPADSTVNELGGAESQVDSDGDSITNDRDLCAGTAAGTEVDASGCSQAQRDDDGDGVLNAADLCAGSPEGVPVGSDGCGPSQVDSDNDGVPNSRDLCLDTPAGQPIDEQGCSADQRGLTSLEAGAAAREDASADASGGSGTRGGANSFCAIGSAPLLLAATMMLAVRTLIPRRRRRESIGCD